MAKVDDDIDALFKLSLSEFIEARKTLAARLKKDGRAADAEYVKLMTKPSVSAWTVNQLYWEHRETFDQLIAAGQRFRKLQTSRQSGKVADMRDALDARREALTQLSDIAAKLLRDAGHNPTLDMLRRITTTLEAVSAYESLPDGAAPGRLTKDVDPPGFESLASFVPVAVTTKRVEESTSASSSKKAERLSPKTPQKPARVDDSHRIEKTRLARIAAAKSALRDAKKSFADARVRVQSLAAAQKKLDAATKEAEKQRRETEERFKKAGAIAEDAARRARSGAVEADEATKAFEEARRAVEKATRELETSFRERPGR
jgi:hypothetical protein